MRKFLLFWLLNFVVLFGCIYLYDKTTQPEIIRPEWWTFAAIYSATVSFLFGGVWNWVFN